MTQATTQGYKVIRGGDGTFLFCFAFLGEGEGEYWPRHIFGGEDNFFKSPLHFLIYIYVYIHIATPSLFNDPRVPEIL